MDLTQALAKIKELETQVATVTTENGELKGTNTQLTVDLVARDESIAGLKKQASEQAQNFKKVRDMSEKEKELYTEKELELLQRNEKLEEDRLAFEAKQTEFNGKQRSAIIDNLAKRFARGDAEIEKQIKINLGKLDPAQVSLAMTEAELTPHIESALNMTGTTLPANDPLREAHNFGGGNAPVEKTDDFSTTAEGKATASALGLQSAKVEVKATEPAA